MAMGNDINFSNRQYKAYSVFIGVFFVIGFAAQIIAITALRRIENRSKKLTVYWLNLTACNILVITASFPISFASAVSQGFVGNETGCQVVGFLAGLGCIGSLINLSISVIKIFNTLTSMKANNIIFEHVLSQRYSDRFAIFGIWLYSILCIMPPLVGWGSFTYEAGQTNCAPDWRGNSFNQRSYILFLVVATFVMPIVVSCVYLRKVYKYFQNKKMVSHDGYKKAFLRSNKQVTIIAAMMFVSCITGWTPYAICTVISGLGGRNVYNTTSSFFVNILAKSSFTYNPLLFLCFSERFRKSIIRLFKLQKVVKETLPVTETPVFNVCEKCPSKYIGEPRPPVGIPHETPLPQRVELTTRSKKKTWFSRSSSIVRNIRLNMETDL